MAIGDAGTTIMFAAIFGLLIGIVWSLRYIVALDRKIEKMDYKIERMLEHMGAKKKRVTRKRK